MIRNENTTHEQACMHTQTHIHAHTQSHTHTHKPIISAKALIKSAEKHIDLSRRVGKEYKEGHLECLGRKTPHPYCENAHMTLVSLPSSLFTPT